MRGRVVQNPALRHYGDYEVGTRTRELYSVLVDMGVPWRTT